MEPLFKVHFFLDETAPRPIPVFSLLQDYRRSVLEQVAAMRSMTDAKVCDLDTIKRLEGRWNAALLNASATVHVKATQLAEVQAYHKQMRIIKAFLEVLAGEREKSSL